MSTPRIDEFDVLWHEERWVALGPIEAKLARELAASPGQVVPRERLAAAWGDAPPRANTVDRQMHRLRLHLAAVGLALHTIRGHGYLLDALSTLT